MSIDLEQVNAELADKSPVEIIQWAANLGKKMIVTTNFGPHEAVILHAATQVQADLPVVWIDSGYNTRETYVVAEQIMSDLNLNMIPYTPLRTAKHRDAINDGIPNVDDPKHEQFTYEVKLEPFQRAMGEVKPEVWLTAIRKEQTAFRASLDIVTEGADGVIKVAPVFYMSEAEMDKYLADNGLPNVTNYYDPTKVLGDRECGLHTSTAK